MKTFFSQNKILIWLVMFLLLLNLSVIGTIIYHKYKIEHKSSSFVPQQFSGRGKIQGGGSFLKEYLRLDEKQFTRFRITRNEFQQKAEIINNSLKEKRIEFLNELEKSNPDEAIIRKVSEDIGKLHADLITETSLYYLDLNSLCTKEQLPKLHSFFKQMFEREESMPSTGRFNRQGQGRTQHNNLNKNMDSI